MFKFLFTLNILLMVNSLNVNLQQQQQQVNNNFIMSARVQCEYKDIDGDSLILNCSLLTGLGNSGNNNGNSNLNNVNNNNNGGINNQDVSLDASVSGNIISGGSSNMNIRVGVDKIWRTPWESLSINHNIIKTIVWRHSRISEMGEYAFKDLNFLQRVDLSFNKLHQLTSQCFKNFELDLLELDLSHNLFQQVPIDLFTIKHLQNVEILRLNENPIVHLHRKPLEYIRGSLKSIEMNYCQIRSLDLNTFDDMKQLESISLIGNHLRYLNEYTFRDLSLRSFYVHDNPLVCDCHMRWLINYLKNVDYQQQTYDSQVVASAVVPFSQIQQRQVDFKLDQLQNHNYFNNYLPQLSVANAAQQLLKCDQPNSLKSRINFLDINPDSFMCDVQISIRDHQGEAIFDAGEDAIITCDVYGDPEPVIYWSFGQIPIEKALKNEDDKYTVTEIRSPFSVNTPKSSFNAFSSSSNQLEATNKTSELRIRNLQSSDIGIYTCTAEISGSNNRKQTKYKIKHIRGSGLSGLSSAGGLVVGSVGILAAATSSLFNRPLSNWTLMLLFGIVISLIIFILMLSSFIFWKCRKRKNQAIKLITSEQKLHKKKEQEKLLVNQNGLIQSTRFINNEENDYKTKKYDDHLDHRQQIVLHNQNINHLSNDSSATLISNNKMTNSIRMAYPNTNTINSTNLVNLPLNDIYTNHSLLTTTSTTTGSYLANNNNNPAIAIDTSNHTPKYHLISQHQNSTNVMDSYYDDLKYNEDLNNHLSQLSGNNNNSAAIYSSPYRQHQHQSYSPIIRRDDPTVPLYATLKPKLIQQQQRQQYSNYSSNSYIPYSTIHRNNNNNHTPPLPLPRRALTATNNYQQTQLALSLPPPPPPPPPIKPKRTFEYVIGSGVSRDLHSESGAFLLGGEDYEHNDLINVNDANQQNIELINHQNQINKKTIVRRKKSVKQEQGSTTSLDEEDLDLNDLKDFEDVTFDNLRKPGEQQKENIKKNSSSSTEFNQDEKLIRNNQTTEDEDVNNLTNNTNSEHSLLLKSSEKSSSFDNTINNKLNLENQLNTSTAKELDSKKLNFEKTNDEESKNQIYEETEI